MSGSCRVADIASVGMTQTRQAGVETESVDALTLHKGIDCSAADTECAARRVGPVGFQAAVADHKDRDGAPKGTASRFLKCGYVCDG